MRRLTRLSRRFLVVRLALLALVLGIAIPPLSASAQYHDVQSNAPFEQLAGLQFAGQRLYQGSNELNISIDVAVFDTVENAAAGLTALSTYYLESYAAAASPIPFEPADPPADVPDALAWHGFLDIGTGPYAEIALVQVQDSTTVLTTFVSNYAYDSNPEELAMEVAGAMLGAILAVPAPAVSATPAAIDPASIMARLPLETDEVPASYGMTYSEDTEWFVAGSAAEPGAATEEVDAGSLLYGDAPGLQVAIARSYEPADEATAGVVNVYLELATFDSDDNAETGFANAEASLLAEIESGGYALEPIDTGIESDESRAWAGQVEDSGTLVVVIARSGPDIVASVVVGSGEDDPVEFTSNLVQSVLDAEAGEDAETYDPLGASSGGLWDRLPASGDEVLNGLEPYNDEEVYP